jgi:cell division septum initiation protein DivIVA
MEQIIEELNAQAEREQQKIESRNSALESQLREAEQRAAELKAAILLASGSEQRFLNFQPFLNGQFQCPRCWIANNIHTNLHQVDNEGFDTVECRVSGCGFHAEVPA